VTSAATDNEGRELLRALGMPFRENKKEQETETSAA
jgi:large subunit ribosomal protein L5